MTGGSLLKRCGTKRASPPQKRQRVRSRPTAITNSLLEDIKHLATPKCRSVRLVSSMNHQNAGGSLAQDDTVLAKEEKEADGPAASDRGSKVSSPFEVDEMDEELMIGSSPDFAEPATIGLSEPAESDVKVPLADRVESTRVIPSALLHGRAIELNDTLRSAGQASTLTSSPISDLAFFEKLRVKMAEYGVVESSFLTNQTPAILLQNEEARSTIRLAKTKTLDDFMEQGQLTSLQEAIRVLVQNKILSSSVLTVFEGLKKEIKTIADHPQKEIEYRLKLEAPLKLEALVDTSAVQCMEAFKVAQRSWAKVEALEIQLQAAREKLKATGCVFLQMEELLTAQHAELLEKRAQAECAKAGLSKLADERSAVEAALAAFKSTLMAP